jgi:hypothetical protein
MLRRRVRKCVLYSKRLRNGLTGRFVDTLVQRLLN